MSPELTQAFLIFLTELGSKAQSGSPISEAIKNLQKELKAENRRSRKKKDDDTGGIGFAVV